MVHDSSLKIDINRIQNLEDLLYFYAKNNLVLVNIYIKDPVVTKIWRDEKTPVIHFVAYTGGLLGLCMGFSLVSLFEIIYYSLKTLPWKTWLRMKEIRFVFFSYDPNYLQGVPEKIFL